MISAASAQIEAIGGDHMKTTIIKDGKSEVVPDYAKVQGILLGIMAALVIFITTIGPECVSYPIFHPNLEMLICACFPVQESWIEL
jgi:SHS family lactate transporter-like MFS transporter